MIHHPHTTCSVVVLWGPVHLQSVLYVLVSSLLTHMCGDLPCKDSTERARFTGAHHSAALRRRVLTCTTLMNEYMFEILTTPYNVTWYDQRTGREVTGDEDGTVVNGTKLWFLKITMEHQGKYLCVVRTPDGCYKQATVLLVGQPISGECGRPQKAPQWLHVSGNDNLACPLRDYTEGAESFSIQWYKASRPGPFRLGSSRRCEEQAGCELLQEGPKFIFLDSGLVLLVRNVSPKDIGFYTCRMTFVLGGLSSEVAETIECVVTGAVSLRPQMIEPSKENVTVALGSPFEKQCRVFIPGTDYHTVLLEWVFGGSPSERIQQTRTNESYVAEGVWLETTLRFSEVLKEDFDVFFNCVAHSNRGAVQSHFLLQPAAQTDADGHRRTQTDADGRRRTQTDTGGRRRTQADADRRRRTPTDADGHRQTQTDTGGHRQTQTDTDGHRRAQTDTDGHRQTQTDTDGHRQTQTDTDRHRRTQTDTGGRRQTQTDTGGRRRTQTDADGHRRTPTDTDRRRRTQADTDRCRRTQTDADGHRQTQTDADGHRRTPTVADGSRQTQTDTDRHRRMQTDADGHRRTQTDTDRHRQTLADTGGRRRTQTDTDGRRRTQTDTDGHWRTQTDTGGHRQTQTDTDAPAAGRCAGPVPRGDTAGQEALDGPSVEEPDLLLPIGLLLTLLALLFLTGVFLYREFKVELVLAFRTLCPFLYESTDGDGKLYDAYVVYPRFHDDTSSEAFEIFAMKTLPQVLEGSYGYRLFILGRDSVPGQGRVLPQRDVMLCVGFASGLRSQPRVYYPHDDTEQTPVVSGVNLRCCVFDE
ncbi:hypothetical protein NFI96_016182 [Prochilodus magdalenae]|nr:hypothetical protein NFI96_016182 [Prochilodus magdalenae]